MKTKEKIEEVLREKYGALASFGTIKDMRDIKRIESIKEEIRVLEWVLE